MLVAAIFGALALSVSVPPAAAKAPCWRQIINDWLDNERIDNVYELHCYAEAIKHIPNDLRQYSDIVEDITSARQQVIRSNSVRTNEPLRTTQSRKTTGRNGTNPIRKGNVGGPTTPAAEPSKGLYGEAIDKVGPRNADSVPLPLMILAGLALLLITAGATGVIAKRFRGRRIGSA